MLVATVESSKRLLYWHDVLRIFDKTART